jgi:hypothetical protein
LCHLRDATIDLGDARNLLREAALEGGLFAIQLRGRARGKVAGPEKDDEQRKCSAVQQTNRN